MSVNINEVYIKYMILNKKHVKIKNKYLLPWSSTGGHFGLNSEIAEDIKKCFKISKSNIK